MATAQASPRIVALRAMISLTLFLACLGVTGLAATAWLWSRDAAGGETLAPGPLEGMGDRKSVV